MPRRSNIHNKIREDCTQETQSGQESIVKSVGKQVCVCVGARVSVCLVVNQSCVIEWAWVHMRGCECMEAHVWVCMRGCACVDVDVNAWMSMCGFTCVDVHVWMCTCGCACVDFYFHLFFIFLRSPLCCACVDVPVWVCMCGCACVCGPIVTDTPERVSGKNRGIVSDRLARGYNYVSSSISPEEDTSSIEYTWDFVAGATTTNGRATLHLVVDLCGTRWLTAIVVVVVSGWAAACWSSPPSSSVVLGGRISMGTVTGESTGSVLLKWN
eukprot:scpid84967/ scgid0650/ 